MATADPPPLKWSDLRYVFDIKEDCNGKEAIQALDVAVLPRAAPLDVSTRSGLTPQSDTSHQHQRCSRLHSPRGTPPAIVQKLSAALIGALKDPDLVKRFREISTEPMPADRATPEAAQRTLTSEIDRWAPIIKAAGEYAD